MCAAWEAHCKGHVPAEWLEGGAKRSLKTGGVQGFGRTVAKTGWGYTVSMGVDFWGSTEFLSRSYKLEQYLGEVPLGNPMMTYQGFS